MGKPRVFISHSALGDPPALALLDLIKEALKQEFAVLIDMYDIPTASEWRRVLNTWIGDCHAAVLLLSKKALKSEFVAYEASILRYREEAKNCKVIPVFIDPVTYKTVQKSRLRAAAIDHRQAITLISAEEIVAKVREALASVQVGRTPLDIQAVYAMDILKGAIPPDLATERVRQLNLDSWQEEDPHRALAVALMGTDLRTAAAMIHQMRHALKGEVMNLFRIIAESWVDSKSTRAIAAAAKGERAKRAVSVNAGRTITAECYIHRASEYPPSDCWPVAPIDGVSDENVLEALKGKVERALSKVFNVENAADLAKQLAANDLIGIPTFVVIPGAGIDKEVLASLRDAFQSVTFFVLAGDDLVAQSVLKAAEVSVLEPVLDARFEEDFHLIYSSAETVLKG